MRIGVDATCWANGRGYGRFARELMQAMTALAPNDEFVCFGDERAFAAFPNTLPNVTRVTVALSQSPTVAAAADGNRSPIDMLRLTRSVWRSRPTVFFSPSVYTYFPLPPGLPCVVTIHDTIAERFPHLTLPNARARLFWRVKVGLALHQARIVLTVSDYSARSIADVLGVAPTHIRVAVEAPAAVYQPSCPAEIVSAAERAGIAPGARWFTYVGGFSPHKRLDVIVRAHARVVHDAGNSPPFLVLVGATQGDVFLGEAGRIRAMIEELGTASYVRWPGFIPDEELRHLHSGAVATLLVSECEGFGLPAVEAAACGTPVIATTESPLPELLAGGGIFVHPGDEGAVADAMRHLLRDGVHRAALGRRARERATSLTWPACARATLDAIHEAAA
ncbi:MAG: glycosyltransferase family 1 protein [Gemmatimonadaceae bacterium]